MRRTARIRLTPKDKKVIEAFTEHRPMESKNLSTDGQRLDGNWMGGTGIAFWRGSKIMKRDLGSASAETVQNYLDRATPANWLGGWSQSTSMRGASARMAGSRWDMNPWDKPHWDLDIEPEKDPRDFYQKAPSTGSKENLALLRVLEEAGIPAEIMRGSVRANMRPRLAYRTLLKAVRGVKIFRDDGIVEIYIPHPSLVRLKADIWFFEEGSDHVIFSLLL